MNVQIKGGKEWTRLLRKKLAAHAPVLRIGILEGATYGSEGEELQGTPAGTPVAQVAAINEFGGPNTPPRPFLRQAVREHGKEWTHEAAKRALAYSYDFEKAFGQVGELAHIQIQELVENWSGPNPHNAPATIARKAAAGVTPPDHPLVFTGTLRDAISYDIKPRGSER